VRQDAAELRVLMGRAQDSSSSGGLGAGRGATGRAPTGACLLEVLQSFSMLAGGRMRLLYTREWQLGGPVESAVLTGSGALVWTTPSPTSSANRRRDSFRGGGRVKVLAAQLVAADVAGSLIAVQGRADEKCSCPRSGRCACPHQPVCGNSVGTSAPNTTC
ncbi:hypothetical protein Vafri_3727, partial [Volvox africanus]